MNLLTICINSYEIRPFSAKKLIIFGFNQKEL